MSHPSTSAHEFAVIGAGINGAAVAREITRRFPNASVTVFEKSDHVAAHQSSHNSGVVHAGLYYEPGSLKARLCRRGVELIRGYAQEKKVPYEECGKLVVALTEAEEPRLRDIYERAVANGVPDVELVSGAKIQDIEPNAVGRLALYSPHTAIIDFSGIAQACIEEVRQAGNTIYLNAEVIGMSNNANGCSITSRHDRNNDVIQTKTFDYVIACAGLHSD